MGLFSDLSADQHRCTKCDNLLPPNVNRVQSREILAEYDQEPHVVIVKDVTCTCGHINRIDYIGEPLSIWFEKSDEWMATLPSGDEETDTAYIAYTLKNTP